MPRNIRPFERSFTIAAAVVACFVVLASFLFAADPPAAPCPAEELVQAKAALTEAQGKSAEIARKLPAGKFTKDFENDKQSADADLKIATTNVENAKKIFEEAKKALADSEKEKKIQHAGQANAQIKQAEDEIHKKMKTNDEQLVKATQARDAFDKDARITEDAKLLEPEKTDLRKQMASFMDSAKADPILEKLGDPAARLEANRLINDKSYQVIEFTEFTPDGDLRGNAERLADQFTTFGDRKTAELRRQIQAAAKDARDRKAGAMDEIRRLGPELIKDLDRCREPINAAFAKVSNRQDAIEKRMLEINADGAELVKKIPELAEESKKLTADLAALNVQGELAAKAAVVSSAQSAVEIATRALEDARKKAKEADQALADNLAIGKSMEPWIKKEKAAQADVDRLTKTVETETKEKGTAMSQAQTDYAANEKDLAEFRVKMTKEKADINKLRADPMADHKALNERIKKAVKDVKDKKEAAVKALEKIKGTLDKYRQCFKDVDDYVNSTLKTKIHALGGTASAGLAVSDTEDPLDALMDIPVDKTVPQPPVVAAAEEWIRSAPVIASDNTDGKMPKGLKASTTSLTYTVEKDGKSWTNTLTWSEPPATLKKGDIVTLTINSTTQEGWGTVGGWWNIRCHDRDSFKGDTAAGSPKNYRMTGSPDPHNATCTFKFDPNAYSTPYIQISAGHDPNPSEWMLVTWKYERKKK